MAARRLQLGDPVPETLSLGVYQVKLDSGLLVLEATESGLLTNISATETEERHQDELLEYIQIRFGISLSLAAHLYNHWCTQDLIKRLVSAEATPESEG